MFFVDGQPETLENLAYTIQNHGLANVRAAEPNQNLDV